MILCFPHLLQRSDSADSAYGGSQESATMAAEQHGPVTNLTQFQYAMPVVLSDYGNKAGNGSMANPETVSDLCLTF